MKTVLARDVGGSSGRATKLHLDRLFSPSRAVVANSVCAEQSSRIVIHWLCFVYSSQCCRAWHIFCSLDRTPGGCGLYDQWHSPSPSRDFHQTSKSLDSKPCTNLLDDNSNTYRHLVLLFAHLEDQRSCLPKEVR